MFQPSKLRCFLFKQFAIGISWIWFVGKLTLWIVVFHFTMQFKLQASDDARLLGLLRQSLD